MSGGIKSERTDPLGHEKAERALVLYEQGMTRTQIAERLGLRPNHVGGYLQRARQRREKAKEMAE